MENFSAVTTWLRENNRLMKEFASNQSKVRAFFLTSDYPVRSALIPRRSFTSNGATCS